MVPRLAARPTYSISRRRNLDGKGCRSPEALHHHQPAGQSSHPHTDSLPCVAVSLDDIPGLMPLPNQRLTDAQPDHEGTSGSSAILAPVAPAGRESPSGLWPGPDLAPAEKDRFLSLDVLHMCQYCRRQYQ